MEAIVAVKSLCEAGGMAGAAARTEAYAAGPLYLLPLYAYTALTDLYVQL